MKNPKKLLKGFIMMSSILLFTSPVFASTNHLEVVGTSDGKGAVSHGHIKIIPNKNPSPTDPIEPSTPGGSTGNAGLLTIDNVTPLLFDTHELSSGAVEYVTSSQNPNVQVTDIRGTGVGWSLQVSTSPFVDQTDTNKVLKGAIVT